MIDSGENAVVDGLGKLVTCPLRLLSYSSSMMLRMLLEFLSVLAHYICHQKQWQIQHFDPPEMLKRGPPSLVAHSLCCELCGFSLFQWTGQAVVENLCN